MLKTNPTEYFKAYKKDEFSLYLNSNSLHLINTSSTMPMEMFFNTPSPDDVVFMFPPENRKNNLQPVKQPLALSFIIANSFHCC